MTEAEVLGALEECGLTVPTNEDSEPAYVEFDGDLFWVNMNRRGELWINTKEKPRAAFRVVKATPVSAEDAGIEAPAPGEASEPHAAAPGSDEPGAAAPRSSERRDDRRDDRRGGRGRNRDDRPAASSDAGGSPQPLPPGSALLERIVPLMRRNRHGGGISGSMSFLIRALHCSEADLLAGFAGLGLTLTEDPQAEAVPVEIRDGVWWLNRDQRGGVWINGREKSEGARPRPTVAGTIRPRRSFLRRGGRFAAVRGAALSPQADQDRRLCRRNRPPGGYPGQEPGGFPVGPPRGQPPRSP